MLRYSATGSIDRTAFDWVVDHRVHALNDLFKWLSQLDKAGLLWICLSLLIGFVVTRTLRATALVAVLTAAVVWFADSVSFGVKDLVGRTRPFVGHARAHPLVTVHSSSFPAGHAATSFAGAVLLSYLWPRAAPAFLVLAAAVAFSRVYVGVHYPGDVLAGALIGALCGVGGILLLRAARRRGLVKTAAG